MPREPKAVLEDWLFDTLNEYDDVADIKNTDRAADASFLVYHLYGTPEGKALAERLANA